MSDHEIFIFYAFNVSHFSTIGARRVRHFKTASFRIITCYQNLPEQRECGRHPTKVHASLCAMQTDTGDDGVANQSFVLS